MLRFFNTHYLIRPPFKERLDTPGITYHTELSCSVLSLRSTAWLGFFAGRYPGLCDELWWLLWLGLSTSSWWLEWASNPEEHQCLATIKRWNMIRGITIGMIFSPKAPWKEKQAEELVEMVKQHYQDSEKRNQVDKCESKNAVRSFLLFKCL